MGRSLHTTRGAGAPAPRRQLATKAARKSAPPPGGWSRAARKSAPCTGSIATTGTGWICPTQGRRLPKKKLVELKEALKAVKKPSTFAVGGSAREQLPFLPGLKIKGVQVALPLTDRQLIEGATRSLFGRGEATIVDPAIRDTWQFEPEDVECHNRSDRQEVCGWPWGESSERRSQAL